jgi:phage regulator Rha-like protein
MAEIVHQPSIESNIFVISGKKVMLDRDLAELYGVETKNLNKAVKRNIDRFPEEFMFQLTQEEFDSLRFHFGTSKGGRGGTRYLPFAFTEYGVAMLSSVLSSEKAVQINILIIKAFIRMREVITQNKDLLKAIQQIERRLDTHDRQIQIAFAAIKSLMQPPAPQPTVEKSKKKMGFAPRAKARSSSRSTSKE